MTAMTLRDSKICENTLANLSTYNMDRLGSKSGMWWVVFELCGRRWLRRTLLPQNRVILTAQVSKCNPSRRFALLIETTTNLQIHCVNMCSNDGTPRSFQCSLISDFGIASVHAIYYGAGLGCMFPRNQSEY